jgi:hypothetical protein
MIGFSRGSALIVLKDEGNRRRGSPKRYQPLPVVTVSGAPLPLLDQAWAWAHVQVAGAETITPAEAAQLLATEPHRLVSRLLCPRQLEPKTRYTACLVPTFESGRRTGIGQPADEEGNPLAPAWTSGTQSLQLPVYYQWRFTTGVAGDFEELVKRLKPAELRQPSAYGLWTFTILERACRLLQMSHWASKVLCERSPLKARHGQRMSGSFLLRHCAGF